MLFFSPSYLASKITPKQQKHVNELFIRDFFEEGLAVTTVKLASVGVLWFRLCPLASQSSSLACVFWRMGRSVGV